MELELVDYFLNFIVDVFELAVSQFGHFGSLRGFVRHFQHVGYLAVDSSFMGDYFGLKVHFCSLTKYSTILFTKNQYRSVYFNY